MKKVLKLMLPPVLAILLVVGYGSGTIQTIARTITTVVTIQVEKTVTTYIKITTGANMSGWSYSQPSVGDAYWWTEITETVTYVPSITETEFDVSDDNEISEKTVPDEEPHEVPQTPENNYGLFQDKIRNMIADIEKKTQTDSTVANPSSDPIVLDTGNWVSFKGDVYQKLQDSGRPIQITFRYKGKHYQIDIPAGADLMSLVDENGYCGFMNLMAHFGGTELEK